MSEPYFFDDGSSIAWVDKETVRYAENGLSVSIWVDFEPGLFNSGRIIKSSSVVCWDRAADGFPDTIGGDKKTEILRKVQQYFAFQNKKSRIDE